MRSATTLIQTSEVNERMAFLPFARVLPQTSPRAVTAEESPMEFYNDLEPDRSCITWQCKILPHKDGE